MAVVTGRERGDFFLVNQILAKKNYLVQAAKAELCRMPLGDFFNLNLNITYLTSETGNLKWRW